MYEPTPSLNSGQNGGFVYVQGAGRGSGKGTRLPSSAGGTGIVADELDWLVSDFLAASAEAGSWLGLWDSLSIPETLSSDRSCEA